MGDRCVDTIWLTKACPRSALLLYSDDFVQDASYVLGTSVSIMLFRTTAEQLLSWAFSSTRWTSGLMHFGRGWALFFVGPVFGRFRCASGYVFSEESCHNFYPFRFDSGSMERFWFNDRWPTPPALSFLRYLEGISLRNDGLGLKSIHQLFLQVRPISVGRWRRGRRSTRWPSVCFDVRNVGALAGCRYSEGV